MVKTRWTPDRVIRRLLIYWILQQFYPELPVISPLMAETHLNPCKTIRADGRRLRKYSLRLVAGDLSFLKGSRSLYLRTSYQGAPKNNPEGHFRPCQCWRSIWFQIWNKEIGGVSEGPGSQVKVLDEKCQLEMSAMRRTEWEIVFPCRVWRESNGGVEGFERKCCEVTMALCGITVQINEAAMISE